MAVRHPPPKPVCHVTLLVGAEMGDVILMADRKATYPYRAGVDYKEQKVLAPAFGRTIWGAAGDLSVLVQQVGPQIQQEVADGLQIGTPLVARTAQVLAETCRRNVAVDPIRVADILLGLVEDGQPRLYAIQSDGHTQMVMGWAALGSGSPLFSERIRKEPVRTAKDFSRAAHRIILQIEEESLDSNVGLGGQIPLGFRMGVDGITTLGPDWFAPPAQ